MLEFFRRMVSRRKVHKVTAQEVPEEHQGTCLVCEGPIYPGQLIAVTVKGEPVHAGFHKTAEGKDEFCETGAMATAVWTENGIKKLGPSAAEVTMQTGRPVVSDGVHHKILE